MKIIVDRMENAFVFGFMLFRGYAVISLPYLEIEIKSNRIVREDAEMIYRGG